MGAAHILALSAAIMNALPAILKLFVASAVVANFYFALKKISDVRHIVRYSEALGWEIAENGDFESVRILNSTVLTRFAVWLHTETHRHSGFFGKAKKSILIMDDALSEVDFRRLIVKLKTTVAH